MKKVYLYLLLILLPGITISQIRSVSYIDHINPDGTDTTGSITMTVSGGTSPYTYSWTPGNYTTTNISDVVKNNYTVKIKGSSNDSVFYYYNLGYKVKWTNITNISSGVTKDTLSRGGVNPPYGSAISKNIIRHDEDGWIQIVINSTSGYWNIGFLDSASLSLSNLEYDIDYGVSFGNGNLNAQNGSSFTSLTTVTLGDVLRIDKTDDKIYIKKNGTTIYTWTMTASYQDKDLKIKTYVYSNSSIANVGCSSDELSDVFFNHYTLTNPAIIHASGYGQSDSKIILSPRIAGATHTYTWQGGTTTNSITNQAPGTYSVTVKDADNNSSIYSFETGYKVKWTNIYNCSSGVTKDTISRGGSNPPYGSAISKNTLKYNENGWVEVVINNTYSNWRIGFLDSISHFPLNIQNYDIDYGIDLGYSSLNAIQQSSFTFLKYLVVGDVVRLEKISDKIHVKVNGTIFKTWTLSSSFQQKDLKLKLYIYSNSFLPNVGCSFYDITNSTVKNYLLQNPYFEQSTGLNYSDGKISIAPAISGQSHSYTWSPGAVTGTVINNKPAGSYSVSVTDSDNNSGAYDYKIAYKPKWQNLINATFSSETIYGTSGWGTAEGKNILKAGDDGWVQYKVNSISSIYNIVGFCDTVINTTGNHNDIDYGFYHSDFGIYSKEGASISLISYCVPGDIIRLEKTSNKIYIKQNNIIIKTWTITSPFLDKKLKLKAAVWAGNSLQNLGYNFPNYAKVVPLISHCLTDSSGGSISVTPQYTITSLSYSWAPGSYTVPALNNTEPGTYTLYLDDNFSSKTKYAYNIGYKINWENFFGAYLRNDSILPESTPPSSGWAHAVSRNTLKSENNGWAEHVITSSDNINMFGFLDSISPVSGTYLDLDFAFYQKQDSLFVISGNNKTYIDKCSAGDILNIEKNNSDVIYRINGLTVLTSSVSSEASEKDWKIKCLAHTNEIINLGCSFYDTTGTYFPNFIKNNTCIIHNSNYVSADGAIRLSPFNGENYQYQWGAPSNEEVEHIENKPAGDYSVTITDLNNNTSQYVYSIGYKTTWTSFNNLIYRSDTLYSVLPADTDYPNAVSKNNLKANHDGWAEYVLQRDYCNVLGFADSVYSSGIADLDYAFKACNGEILIKTPSLDFSHLAYFANGDIFRIERLGNAVLFKLNRSTLATYTVSEALLAKDWKLKTAVYDEAVLPYITNIGCDFHELQNFKVDKEHADYYSSNSGRVIVLPIDSAAPLHVSWEDYSTEISRSNLKPGAYTLHFTDSLYQKLGTKTIYIGTKPDWKSITHAGYARDSVYLTHPDTMGTLVTNNIILKNQAGWAELTIKKINQDITFGLLGIPEEEIDTLFIPPAYHDSTVNNNMYYMKTLARLAVNDSLNYTLPGGILTLGSEFANLHLVRLHNGKIQPLFNYALKTDTFSYKVGDIIRVGRNDDGKVFLALNDSVLLTELYSSSDASFLSGIAAKTNGYFSTYGMYTDNSVNVWPFPYCKNDKTQNWAITRTFDGYGNVVSENKEYFDDFARPIQSQARIISENNTLASEFMYDSHGRGVGQTLPAPLYNYLCYQPLFFANGSNLHYDLGDFDKKVNTNASGEINNPAPAGNANQGTLGWYYSENNSTTGLIPSDNHPYQRIEFSHDPLNRPIRSAGAGKHHKMGSGHEGLIIYTNSGTELLAVYPKKTYELDENFNAKTYPNNAGIIPNIYNARKTITINADGHDNITYTNDAGQVLATCVSGFDSDCPDKQVINEIKNNSFTLLHVTKQKNNTLKFLDANFCSCFAYFIPVLRLYTTKDTLVSGTDYNYNSTTGEVTFLNDFATNELFLEVSYKWDSMYTPAGSYKFLSTHELGYTQWTVYYYDVKGRIKAIQCPNDVKCNESPVRFDTRIRNSSRAFSCDTTEVIHTVELNHLGHDSTGVAQNINIKLQPLFNSFDSLLVYNTPVDFKFQTNDTLAPRDTLWNFSYDITMGNDTIIIIDTIIDPPYFIDDTLLNLTALHRRNNIPALVNGKSITYTGQYIMGVSSPPGPGLPTGTTTWLYNRPVDFEYDVVLYADSLARAVIYDKRYSENHDFFIPDSVLTGADNIVVKCRNLQIKATGFTDVPLQAFNPCDTNRFYVSADDAELLANINANISMKSTSNIDITVPLTPTVVTFCKQYYYNEYDHLVASATPDEGRTDYLYDLKEDKIMFSQNDKQRANNEKFSYIKYDDLGRAIESGEFDPAITDNGAATNYKFQTWADWKNNVPPGSGYTSTGLIAANNSTMISTTRYTEQKHIVYDTADVTMPLQGSGYAQTHTGAKVSKTYNADNTSWYSYDETGNLKFLTQNTPGLGIKTLDYSYDLLGNLLTSQYQKNNADVFKHQYNYDADKRLKTAFYCPGSGTCSPYKIAEYYYYLHGPVRRLALGNNLQGLDYVYTINGLLKSLNNPAAFYNGDPGNDGSNGFSADVFSYALDYYPFDYQNTNSPLKLSLNNGTFANKLNISYTGLIWASRWHTTYPSGSTPPALSGGGLMYEYKYNELYRLTDAIYGTFAANNGTLALSGSAHYKTEGITYDKNGNLKTLKRYTEMAGGNPVLMDDLTYTYSSSKKNRLNRVSDAITASLGLPPDMDLPHQSTSLNYSYNAIGQLTVNTEENQRFEYNSEGLTTLIRLAGGPVNIAEFKYNERGQRILKTSHDIWGTPVANTWYVYNEAGALQTTYFEDLTATTPTPVVQDYVMQGGGRMGIYDVGSAKPYFELSDHLGNVRAVFTDNAGAAQPLTYTDYYPHGGIMPGSYHVSTPDYRYNYQGQEKDKESGLVNFELRQFDTRTARWLAPDPYGQHYSPYLSMSNNPINNVDPDGGLDWFATSALQNSNLMADINYNGRNWHNMTPFERNVVQAENGIGYEEFYKDRFFTAASFAGGYKARDGSIYNLGGDGWLTQHQTKIDGYYYTDGYFTNGGWSPLTTRTSNKIGTVEKEKGFWSRLDNTIGSALFGNKANYNAIKQNSGDNNPYMFSSKEIQNAAIFELELLSLAIPVGEIYQTSRVALGLGVNRVFWSGGYEAMNAATNYAAKIGGKTLEMTIRGKFLTSLTKATSASFTRPLWKFASWSFAKGTTGTANVFLKAGQVNPKGIWMSIEKRALESNGINIIEKTIK